MEEQVRTEGSSIPVYSPFSGVEAERPEQLARLFHERCERLPWSREKYPQLAWPMESLVDTTWRNVHCGALARVGAVAHDRWGNPVLPIQSERAWGSLAWWLGLWTSECAIGRYVIEHWVRVDQLPVEDQAPWFAFRVRWCTMRVREDTQRLAESQNWDHTNRKLREGDLAQDQREVAYAERQWRQFAAHAGFPVPAEFVNDGKRGEV